MDTFGDPHLGTGMEDPNLFNPTALDCNQWVEGGEGRRLQGDDAHGQAPRRVLSLADGDDARTA